MLKPLFSTYLSTFSTLIMPILSIPFYLKYLGENLWGVVSLIMLIQLAFVTLEQGFSQALLKEFSTLLHQQNLAFLSIKNTIQRYYMYFGGFCAAFIAIFGALLMESKVDGLITLEGKLLLFLISGFTVMVQILSSFERVVLVSAEKHQSIAEINIFIQVIRHSFGVLIAHLTESIIALVGWFFLCCAIELLMRSRCAERVCNLLDSNENSNFDQILTNQVTLRSLKTSLAVLLGALTVYIDRFVVGEALSVNDLGLYTIASTVSLGVVQLIYPVGQIFLPKLIQARSKNEDVSQKNAILLKWFLIFSIFVFFIFISFGISLINFWLQNPSISEKVYFLLKILLFGSFFNGIFNIGYWNWLSTGDYKKIANCYLTCFSISAVLVPLLVDSFGLKGAAIGWVTSNFICFLFSASWMQDVFSKKWNVRK